ncbi:MAG: CAP domain-containing protein [Patescibacteria group bacterium]
MFKRFKNFFLPHTDNNCYPHIWKLPGTLVFLGVILLVESYFFTGSYLLISGNNFLASVFPNALIAFTNDVRTEHNVSPLKENKLLDDAAQLKANDMASRGYFSHYTPEGLSPWTFVSKAGYEYDHAGENLAVNFVDSKDVVDAWVASPKHYENLVKDEYTEIGIATAEGVYQGKKTIFIVQFFGTPAQDRTTNVLAALPVEQQKPAAKPVIAPVIAKAEPKILTREDINGNATTSFVAIKNQQVSLATTSSPTVKGLESDTPTPKESTASFFLTYPKHIVTIVLGLLVLVIFILFFTSLRRHNTEHHLKITQIAFYFILIIALVLALNFFFAKGVI